MQEFLKPKSIAIIGASATKGKIGRILLENLAVNKDLEIFLINPSHKEIMSKKCYASVLDIEKRVDLAVIAIPAAMVTKAVEECAQKKEPIKNIIIISAGFSEAGEKGKELENELKKLAEKYELNILGPNCLGIINAQKNINVSFAKTNIKKGNVGLVMQSGAFTTALIDLAEDNNFGFSSIVTLGNKTLMDEVDFSDYFLKDKNTKIVVFYLETIKRGKDFMEEISHLAKEKPVFILKVGNSKRVQSAIQSHTGSMAGEFEVAKKAIEKSGALYFENIAELVHALKFFNGFKMPRNKKTVIITNAGGPGVIATDLVEKESDIEMLELKGKEQEEIMKALVPACSAQNPIDVLGDADSQRYENVLEKLSKNNEIGSVLALITPQAQTNIEEIAKVIAVANEKYLFPIVPVFIGGPSSSLANEILAKESLCNFKFPAEASKALNKAGEFISRNSFVDEETEKNVCRQGKAGKILDRMKEENRASFFYSEATELAEIYDITSERAVCLEDKDGLENFSELDFPLVMKVDDPEILHKDTNAGVVLGIQNREDLKRAFEKLKNKFKNSKIIIQRQLPPGLEIILGVKKDPFFGTVMLCGLGGIFTEIINEKNLWFVSADAEEIKEDLENSTVGKIFKKKNLNINQLVQEVEKVARLARENILIKELDINPMFFYENKAPVAVDVKGLII